MRKLIYGAAILALPMIANANYVCSGTVSSLALSPDGVLHVSIGSLDNVYLCQIGTTRNGVNSDVCKAIFAQLLSAQTTGKVVQLQFNDAGTCNRSWTDLTGWYFGPRIQ